MTKRAERWPIWKIAAAAVGCAVLSPVLFWLSALLDNGGGQQTTTPSTPAPVMTISSFIAMLGMAAAMLSVLCIIWLAFRIRDARTPAWKKRARKKRI